VSVFLSSLFSSISDNPGDPVAALLPWVCDRLPSKHSRVAYARDLREFVSEMERQGVSPIDATGDEITLDEVYSTPRKLDRWIRWNRCGKKQPGGKE
jgi:hypothetical protein